MNQTEIFQNMTKGEVHRCSRCNEKLNNVRWLELSITDGKYYEGGKFPKGHESQGFFPFGSACFIAQLKNDHK